MIHHATSPAPDQSEVRPVVFAPRKYGNPYFDCMEAPLSLWPEQTRVRFPSGLVVQIPTAEVWTAGDFLSRQYAGVKFSKVTAWLARNHYRPESYSVLDIPDVRPDPSYSEGSKA